MDPHDVGDYKDHFFTTQPESRNSSAPQRAYKKTEFNSGGFDLNDLKSDDLLSNYESNSKKPAYSDFSYLSQSRPSLVFFISLK